MSTKLKLVVDQDDVDALADVLRLNAGERALLRALANADDGLDAPALRAAAPGCWYPTHWRQGLNRKLAAARLGCRVTVTVDRSGGHGRFTSKWRLDHEVAKLREEA